MPPRTRPCSIYTFECLCGHHLESETPQTECPWCHRQIRLIWPARAAGETNLEESEKEK